MVLYLKFVNSVTLCLEQGLSNFCCMQFSSFSLPPILSLYLDSRAEIENISRGQECVT